MRVQVRFGLLDYEEGVVALSIGNEAVEFETLQRQEDQVRGSQARIADSAYAVVDQQPQAAQQCVDSSWRKSERHRNGMLLPSDGD